jgi:hypothetical protein
MTFAWTKEGLLPPVCLEHDLSAWSLSFYLNVPRSRKAI